VGAAGATAMTDDSVNYLYALKDNAVLQVSTTFPVGEYALRFIVYTWDGDIHHIFTFPLMSGGLRESLWKHLADVHPNVVKAGLSVAEDADATQTNDFTIAAGSYYSDVLDLRTIADTLYSAGVGHVSDDAETFYHVAGAWTEGVSRGVDFAQFDDPDAGGGQALAAVDNAKWYCGFVFLENNNQPIYVYPQYEYAKAADAVDAPTTYPPNHTFVVPLAKFIFRGSATDFTNPARAYFRDIRPFHGIGDTQIAFAVQDVFQIIDSDAGSTTADHA
ncbi:unnamed protein product, partial [marine sediment metagenome]